MWFNESDYKIEDSTGTVIPKQEWTPYPNLTIGVKLGRTNPTLLPTLDNAIQLIDIWDSRTSNLPSGLGIKILCRRRYRTIGFDIGIIRVGRN
jgi:hypothetical protein